MQEKFLHKYIVSGVNKMDNTTCNSAKGHENRSIECSVKECAHHANVCNYCTLSCIKVGTHEQNPTMYQCTDCNSFELKK